MRMRCVGTLIAMVGVGAVLFGGLRGVRSAFVLDHKRALNSQQSRKFGRYLIRINKRQQIPFRPSAGRRRSVVRHD